jgi:hypothetical protein
VGLSDAGSTLADPARSSFDNSLVRAFKIAPLVSQESLAVRGLLNLQNWTTECCHSIGRRTIPRGGSHPRARPVAATAISSV